MSTNPPPDPDLNSSGAEPVYGPAYTAVKGTDGETVSGTNERHSGSHAAAPGFRAANGGVGPQPPAADAPSPPYTAPYPPYPYDPPPTYGMQPNMAAGLAYMTLVPAVFFLLMEPYKSNRLIRFHSWQSIFFFLAVAAVRAVESVLDATLPVVIAFAFLSVVSLALLAAWLVAVMQAFGGKTYQLPWIGSFAEKASSGQQL